MRKYSHFIFLIACVLFHSLCSAQSGIISTIAGNGVAGYSGDGGPATLAQLNEPTDVRKDAAGNIYIADKTNNRIRKINPAGIISTIAGSGVAGYTGDGGAATLARLKNPDAVAIDAAGNIYIADESNDVIRKVDVAGIITTIVGTGVAGFSGDGGPAISARISKPSGIAVDLAGNIYISDRGNDRVRKVNPAGIISTYAGGGAAGYTVDGVPATSISLCTQNYVSVDNGGTVYITNTGCWHFLKISPAGLIYNVAGDVSPAFTGDCGPATAADIQGPQGICPDNAGNIYLCPRGNRRVRRVNSLNYIVTVAGTGTVGYTGDGGPALGATVSADLAGVYADPIGNIYFADMSNHAIRHFTTTVYRDSATICVGGTVVLSSSTGVGTWVSGNTTVATVTGTVTTGTATGVSGGVAIITFSNIACPDLFRIQVDTLPNIAGATICAGSTVTLSSATAGGSWSSANSSVATVTPVTGVVSGVAAGSATITFTGAGGCYTTTVVTVLTMPAAITGSLTVCAAATTALSNSVGGGTWTSASPGIATVGPLTGLVGGVAAGTSVISYATSTACFVTAMVTVNPLPGAGVITGPSSVCSGAAIALADATPGGVWSSGSSAVATVSATGVVSGVLAGLAMISYSVTNSCGTAVATKLITVNRSDTTRFGLDTSVCTIIGPIILNAPGGYTSYIWSTGGITSSITVSVSGVYIDYATAACDTRIDTFNVTYDPMPSVWLGNDTAFCVGNTYVLSSPQPPGSTYLWSTGSSATTLPVSTTGTYWLKVTNGFGCSTTDTIHVIVSPVPVVNLGPDTTVCNGGPNTLQSHVTYPASAAYLWSDGSTTPSITVLVTGTYWLQVTDGGCPGSDTIRVIMVHDTLHVYTPDTAICRGASVYVVAAGNPAVSYQWLPTAGIPISTILNPVITPDTSATYILTGRYPGCPDVVDSFHIDVQPNPEVHAGGNRFVCKNDTLHLHAVVTPGWYSHYIYSWSPGVNLDDSTASVVVFTPGDSTKIVITVTTSAGCTSKDSAMIYVFPDNTVSYSGDFIMCPHDSAQFLPVASDPLTGYTWHPAMYLSDATSAQPWVFPITSQGYMAVATSRYGCLDTVYANVTVRPGGIINLGDSVIIYPGESYQLSPQTNCATFIWSPAIGLDKPLISNPVATPLVSTTYIVHGATEGGCLAADSINIHVSEVSLFDLPNAFTPGSGVNNIFKIIKRGMVTLHYFRIYNRWGNLVYETTNIDEGWDGTYKGKQQPFGVYVYNVEGVSGSGRVIQKHGNVTLVR